MVDIPLNQTKLDNQESLYAVKPNNQTKKRWNDFSVSALNKQ